MDCHSLLQDCRSLLPTCVFWASCIGRWILHLHAFWEAPAFPEVNRMLELTLANGFPAWNSLLCVPPHSWPSPSHPDQCVPHHSPDHFSLSLCGNRSVSSTTQKAPGGRSLGLTSLPVAFRESPTLAFEILPQPLLGPHTPTLSHAPSLWGSPERSWNFHTSACPHAGLLVSSISLPHSPFLLANPLHLPRLTPIMPFLPKNFLDQANKNQWLYLMT